MARQDLGWSGLLSMGMTTAMVLIAGVGLGWLVDLLADTSPVFLLSGVLLGIIGASSYTISQFRKYMSD